MLLLGRNPSGKARCECERRPNLTVTCQMDIFATVLHHPSNSLGQLHQHRGANGGLGVAFTPSVSLSSQNHVTICRSTIDRSDKEINVLALDQLVLMALPGSMNPLMTPKTLTILRLTSTLLTSTVMFSRPPSLYASGGNPPLKPLLAAGSGPLIILEKINLKKKLELATYLIQGFVSRADSLTGKE